MIVCTFELNGKEMSTLVCGANSFPAFSGLWSNKNKREFACSVGTGPIPPGRYFIVDRESGGFLARFRDIFNDKKDWFALYAADKKIDDEMFCKNIKRGQFRLHPKGTQGISQGCITLDEKADFYQLSRQLRSHEKIIVPGSELKAYGMVLVK